jgi:hypothetical protein
MVVLSGLAVQIGLQLLSLVFAVWSSWTGKIVIAACGVAVAAYLLWPSGTGVERAVLEALGQRETITNANIDEEKRDNAWLEEWEKNTAAERDAAAKAAGPADRVIWRADDPWLRTKRTAKSR